MKENKIVYKSSGYGDCFFEYEGKKIKKALMFHQMYDSLYIGINAFDNDNRFEIKNEDELYPFFDKMLEEDKVFKIENHFCKIKMFKKDKKIIFRFDFKYQNISFPIEIEDKKIKNRILSFLEDVRSENINNVKTKKLRRQNS